MGKFTNYFEFRFKIGSPSDHECRPDSRRQMRGLKRCVYAGAPVPVRVRGCCPHLSQLAPDTAISQVGRSEGSVVYERACLVLVHALDLRLEPSQSLCQQGDSDTTKYFTEASLYLGRSLALKMTTNGFEQMRGFRGHGQAQAPRRSTCPTMFTNHPFSQVFD